MERAESPQRGREQFVRASSISSPLLGTDPRFDI